MNCENLCCDNGHGHHDANERYGINVTAMAHTMEPLLVEEAAELVPLDMRKPGTKITFWSFEGWQTWQFLPMDVREWVLPESWKREADYGMDLITDLQNQIDSIQIGGWAVSNELGNDPHIGISQKALTELIGFDNVQDTIRGRITKVENEIGSDTTSESLSGRVTSLEDAVGTGGSVDARINQAKSQVIGTASSDYNTLGKLESKIKEEANARSNAVNGEYSRAYAAEGTLNAKIDTSVTSLTGSVNTERNRALGAEELLRQAYEALTQSDIVVGALPGSGTEAVIYRVPGTNSYKDYMWNGSQFVEMAEYDNAIDDEPTKNSNNVIKSGAIYKFLEDITTNSGEYKFAVTDKNGNAVCAVDSHDKLKVFLDIVAETINGIPAAKIIQNNLFKIAYVDADDNLIFGINKDDKIITDLFDVNILYGTSDVYQKAGQTFCDRHKDAAAILRNDCNYDYMPAYNQGEDLSQNTLKTKRLQMAVVTDTHLMSDTFQNGVDAANGFTTIDATLQLGDMCNWVDTGSDTYETTKATIDSASKPLYITVGNHDVGTRTQYVAYCKDNVQLYNRFVKPAVDKGWLLDARPDFTYKKDGESISFPKVAEYQENKVYFYHDFDYYKVRLIVLYPHDDGDVSVELDGGVTDEASIFDRTYWKPITYNSSYPSITKKHYYPAHDGQSADVVNVPGYDTYSFECVNDVEVTLISKTRGDYDERFNYNPRFKALRRGMWYRKDQLDWLCDRLEEAGEHGYTCIICQHYRFMNIDCYFDLNTRFQNPYKRSGSLYEFRYDSYNKNIISQIVNAYQTKGTINTVLHAYPSEQTGVAGGYDDTSAIPDVVLNRTFHHSGKILFLHGHNHSDAVLRSNRYNQTDIGFICGTLYEVDPIDVNRENTTEGRDLVTCVTIHSINDEQSYAHLTRVGNHMTNRVDENTNTLVSKLNETIIF